MTNRYTLEAKRYCHIKGGVFMAFNPFGQLGEMKKMRDQAMQMQRELQAEIVEVSKRGVYVKITGDQKIIELKSNDKSDDDIREAINEAVKKSQEVAAKKMQSMMGGMGGLAGMLVEENNDSWKSNIWLNKTTIRFILKS